MKSSKPNFFIVNAVASLLCLTPGLSAFGQSCPVSFPPGSPLTSYLTIYPDGGGNNISPAISSSFLVTVSASVSGANPPIPDGNYAAWCVDAWTALLPQSQPLALGTPLLYSGQLYATCDSNLNNELPQGHSNTLVSATTWLEVDYILNNHAGYFYWDVQAAINTFVGSAVGSTVPGCGVLTTPDPDGCGDAADGFYPAYSDANVGTLTNEAIAAVTGGWVPTCGDVIGVVYVTATNSQFLMLEVPVLCAPPTLTRGVISNCYTSLAAATNAALTATTGTNNSCGNLTFSVSDDGQTCPATITVTGTVSCGSYATTIYTTTILTNPPTFSGLPATTATNYVCDSDVPPPPYVTALDSCGAPLTVVSNFSETGAGSCDEVITRNWSATDCAGQQATFMQTITVIDTNSMVLTGVPVGQNLGANPATVPTVANILSEVSVGDTCIPVTPSVTETETTNGCAVTQVFTITATNVCGQTATADVTNTWTTCVPPPGLQLFKNADQLTGNPAGEVLYSYTVTNTGDVTVSNIDIVDDDGTPGYTNDDFTVNEAPFSLAPGQSKTFVVTNIPPIAMCMDINDTNTYMGTLWIYLTNGNVRVVYRQSLSIVDNTYGTNAVGWGSMGHKFDDLVGSDQCLFQFFDGQSNTVLEFACDYVSQSSSFPSDYGTLGPSGQDGSMIVGVAADILSTNTTITTDLNQSSAYYGYTVNSPAPSDPNYAHWDVVDGYDITVSGAVFSSNGFGGVAIPYVHNSPSKINGIIKFFPTPCGTCVTNTATVTGTAAGVNLMTTATASVCVNYPFVDTNSASTSPTPPGPTPTPPGPTPTPPGPTPTPPGPTPTPPGPTPTPPGPTPTPPGPTPTPPGPTPTPPGPTPTPPGPTPTPPGPTPP